MGESLLKRANARVRKITQVVKVVNFGSEMSGEVVNLWQARKNYGAAGASSDASPEGLSRSTMRREEQAVKSSAQ